MRQDEHWDVGQEARWPGPRGGVSKVMAMVLRSSRWAGRWAQSAATITNSPRLVEQHRHDDHTVDRRQQDEEGTTLAAHDHADFRPFLMVMFPRPGRPGLPRALVGVI